MKCIIYKDANKQMEYPTMLKQNCPSPKIIANRQTNTDYMIDLPFKLKLSYCSVCNGSR